MGEPDDESAGEVDGELKARLQSLELGLLVSELKGGCGTASRIGTAISAGLFAVLMASASVREV